MEAWVQATQEEVHKVMVQEIDSTPGGVAHRRGKQVQQQVHHLAALPQLRVRRCQPTANLQVRYGSLEPHGLRRPPWARPTWADEGTNLAVKQWLTGMQWFLVCHQQWLSQQHQNALHISCTCRIIHPATICHDTPCWLETTHTASLRAGIICCQADNTASVGATQQLSRSFPCAVSYGVYGVFYPQMMLGGMLLDDEEMWASLDSLQLVVFPGRLSCAAASSCLMYLLHPLVIKSCITCRTACHPCTTACLKGSCLLETESCEGAVNQLGGLLPASMSKLFRVESVDLSQNQFTATIPSAWFRKDGMTGLSNMFLVCPPPQVHCIARHSVPGTSMPLSHLASEVPSVLWRAKL